MAINLDNFLHSLAEALASACALSYRHGVATAAAKANIFRHGVDEGFALWPYTVLRSYSGSAGAGFVRPARVAVQAMTRGTAPAAIDRAQAIFESLCDGAGCGRMGWTIPGYLANTATADGSWRIIAVEMAQRPGVIGAADERGNVEVGFNADLEFCRG